MPPPAAVSAWWDAATLAVCTAYLVAAPFTKVEESFNVQATHDLLEFGIAPSGLARFDHHEFPGVVPRTFIGALLLAAPAAPVHAVLRTAFGASPLCGLYAIRFVLGGLNVAALGVFRRALAERFPALPTVANTFSLLLCTQFHLPFYMSRPLPNTFALAVCALASAAYVADRARACVWLLAFACAVLRCDCVLLAAPMLLIALARGRFALGTLVAHGVVASLVAVGASVLVDSYFWRRWVWPEGVVFFYNTVENKSSAWGTSPWHWYASSALPRLLLPAALLWWLPRALLGSAVRTSAAAPSKKHDDVDANRAASAPHSVLDWEAVWLAAPSCVFVALYSLLPHKEMRFLFPAAPLLVAVCAVGLAKVRASADTAAASPASTPWIWRVAQLALIAHALAVAGFAMASITNYPGGAALQALHRLAAVDATRNYTATSGSASVHAHRPAVHICNLAAMSGVSRFGEQRDLFTYSKEEHLTPALLASHPARFSWLISEHCTDASTLPPGFEVRERVHAFAGVQREWPFVRFSNALCVLQRRAE